MTTTTAPSPRSQFPKQIPKDNQEARLAIARDVIRHVEGKRLLASRGLYISFHDYDLPWSDSFDNLAASLFLEDTSLECAVCAIGAACMVAVGLYDEAETLEHDWNQNILDDASPADISLDSDGMHEVLEKWFTASQLGLIECAFEGSTEYGTRHATESERLKASNFRHLDQHSSEETLIDIFQNILDNDGIFKP